MTCDIKSNVLCTMAILVRRTPKMSHIAFTGCVQLPNHSYMSSIRPSRSKRSHTIRNSHHRPSKDLAIDLWNHTSSHPDTIRPAIQQSTKTPTQFKMPLIGAHRCQICGDVLFHDDFFSDPSQHFCISVSGPGMTEPHVKICDDVGIIQSR